MALLDNAWYLDSVNYAAVTAWSNTTAVAGDVIRQLTTPAVNAERCFICTTAGATGAVEPTWTTTRGALNTSSVAVYQECTGVAAINGDATNTPTWTAYKAATATATLGQVIQRNNGASYWICTIGGAMGASEPAWANDTAGTTRTDSSATWTCIGVVGNFTGWQYPHARLKNTLATNWAQAGNPIYVASSHAETQAASNTMNISPGSISNPIYIYCVTKTAAPPTSANLTTGASISTTGASDIFLQFAAYFEGISFIAGDSNNNNGLYVCDGTSTGWQKFKNCAFRIRNTGALTGARITIGQRSTMAPAFTEWDNCTVQFGDVAQEIQPCCGKFVWRNTASAIQGATIPTNLINDAVAGFGAGQVYLEGVDLSALGSGKTLVSTLPDSIDVTLKDCKLGASVTPAATPSVAGFAVTLIDCDSGATNYRTEKYAYQATQTMETTIVRSGGALQGSTSVAWKIVTTANNRWLLPYQAIPLAIWNNTTAANVTVTVYGIWGGGAVPNNDDIWFEAEYLGSALTPQASFATVSKADNLASGTALTADTSVWGGSTTAFKMSVTLSSPKPGMTGPIFVYIKVAKASSTFYIDPKPVLS